MLGIRRLTNLIFKFITRFWVPLAITIGMLTVAITFTMVLLVKQQITVQIPNLTLRVGPDVLKAAKGTLKQGEHLNILAKDNGWYQVQREDESTGWVAGWLLERKVPLKHMSLLSEATIELDPGHGGSDSGAQSIDEKHFEKTYTLQLAKRVRNELVENYGTRVVMSRDTDKLVYLAVIPKVGEANRANAFISFHFDSAKPDNSASGFTTYYGRENNGSKDLATQMNQAMSPVMPLTNRGVEQADYVVLEANSVPAILLENGYINTSKDFSYIKSPAYQQKIAQRIPIGLQRYLNAAAKTSH
ncbi:N-acetylmuramoyl-L-alanine amidase [Weissella diestrammenae]|uniref:N-acetylmuramoyl-L-alanine amidase n=1 Tax=Weissella diestrammenae TaxID=1162633 RepID=A0A7G9T5Y6_9LACO|nr:N-acetylmuramoyl-L-alanine amidase [Weissella diestrammenae]MCM0582343.1 N-acetylmuramoyl-L-alanine amidase [Weissella diestrammenae]QNN75511.1 N-acetylmuramoyl-L-alanine amidase [Weissella diestrammenae]